MNWCPPFELVLEDVVPPTVDAVVVAIMCFEVVLVVVVLVVFASAFVIAASVEELVATAAKLDDTLGALQLRRRCILSDRGCLSISSTG